MEKKLQFLESFAAQGDDGQVYQVRVYEHLARLDAVAGPSEQWESTGQAEYKLGDGRHVDVDRRGGLTLRDGGIRLQRTSVPVG
jgi:hypothetical protein